MLNEFLRRFREAGVPGAPAAAGAPGSPAATLEAELAPVFALLEDGEHAAEAIEAEGRRLAQRLRAEAAQQARALLATARARAAGEQAAVTAARFTRSEQVCAGLRRQAVAESARIDQAMTERVPPLVPELVERVLRKFESAATP